MKDAAAIAVYLLAGAMLCGCAAQPHANPSLASTTDRVLAKPERSSYGDYVQFDRDGQPYYCLQQQDAGSVKIHETCLTSVANQGPADTLRNVTRDAPIAPPPISGPKVR